MWYNVKNENASQFAEVMVMKKEYKTGQKRIVLDFFRENCDRHFSVTEVTEAVCKNGAGKSTVYRQISNLLEKGVIRRFESPESPQFVYQYADVHEDCDHHYHLKCVKCGRLIHMECPHLNEVSEHIKAEHNFILGFGKAVLYGECTKCATEN